jgi:hypothetical protein
MNNNYNISVYKLIRLYINSERLEDNYQYYLIKTIGKLKIAFEKYVAAATNVNNKKVWA